jgi:phosphoribosylamine--glycine ligase
MKEFVVRHGIRTARHVTVGSLSELPAALSRFEEPPVVKAVGLCAGKGVIVADSFDQASSAARVMLSGEAFGEAGQTVVLEERVYGEEVSVHAICDGEQALILPPIQDHKRIGEGDTGPNTGGMGTYGPAPVVTPDIARVIDTEVVQRILRGMKNDVAPFRGTLFANVMIDRKREPVLFEINVRFGDPETQVLMNLLDGDFAELLHSAARGHLDRKAVRVNSRSGLCVVLAAFGYPASPRQGDPITGIEEASAFDSVRVYHAGTRREGEVVRSAGGRVLGVSASASTLQEAHRLAYAACDRIRFDGMQFRRDIGYGALQRAAPSAS